MPAPSSPANSPAPKRRHRFLGLALLVAFVVLLASCKVDTTVTVAVHADGSGVVSVHVALDAAAVSAAEADGGKLEERVRLSDLAAAGWTVGAWARGADGSATLELSKPFTKVSEVGGIVREISGTEGPLHDFAVTRDTKLFSTDYTVRGTVDLKNLKTGVQSDQELVQALSAQHVDVNAIDQQLLADVQRSFALHVVVELPGGKKVTVSPAAGTTQSVDESASVRNDDRVLYAVAAGGFLLLAVVVMLNGRRVARKRRRRRAARRRTTPGTTAGTTGKTG